MSELESKSVREWYSNSSRFGPAMFSRPEPTTRAEVTDSESDPSHTKQEIKVKVRHDGCSSFPNGHNAFNDGGTDE